MSNERKFTVDQLGIESYARAIEQAGIIRKSLTDADLLRPMPMASVTTTPVSSGTANSTTTPTPTVSVTIRTR